MKKKQNIKFVLKLAVVIVSFYLLLFLYIKNFPLYYNNVNNTRWWLISETFNKNYNLSDSSITKLFIGDSRPNAGIDFTKIDNSWSFCVGGTSPVENYYLLKKYISVYEKPETVLVSISPRFIMSSLAFWDLAVRNDFFSKEEFNEIKKYKTELADSSFGKNLNFRFLMHKIKFIKYYQEDIRNNLIFCAKEKNINLINYIMTNRGSRPHPNLKEYCSDLNYETKMTDFVPPAIENTYFKKIFELCKENNIKCVFFSMPMNESSFKKLNYNFKTEYKTYILSLKNDFPEFYISDSLYFYPDSLFGDDSHLNEKGKVIFTDELLKKM